MVWLHAGLAMASDPGITDQSVTFHPHAGGQGGLGVAVVGGGVGSRGREGGSSRPEALREISSYGKETVGMGFSLQVPPGFNIVDIPGLSNKCVVN